MLSQIIKLLTKITSFYGDPLISNELGQKFANAVNYSVDHLTTEKSLKFQMTNPERFCFKPNEMLTDLIKIYINMGHDSRFKRFIVRDGRSYSHAMFCRVIELIND